MSPDALTFVSIAASVVGSVAGVVLVGARARVYLHRTAGLATSPSSPDAHRPARLETAVYAIARCAEQAIELEAGERGSASRRA